METQIWKSGTLYKIIQIVKWKFAVRKLNHANRNGMLFQMCPKTKPQRLHGDKRNNNDTSTASKKNFKVFGYNFSCTTVEIHVAMVTYPVLFTIIVVIHSKKLTYIHL